MPLDVLCAQLTRDLTAIAEFLAFQHLANYTCVHGFGPPEPRGSNSLNLTQQELYCRAAAVHRL